MNDCNEHIVRHGLKGIRSAISGDDEDGGHGSASANSGEQTPKPSNATPNQITLLIGPTCVPADINCPTDLSLLNQAREVTETLIDAMHPQIKQAFGDKPLTYRKNASYQFLSLA